MCNREAPAVAAVTTRRDDVRFLGLAGRDSVEAMAGFIDRHGLTGFDHLVDGDGSLWQRFGIVSQPAWVFVDDDGTAHTVAGALGEDGLDAEIDRLVASSPASDEVG